MKLLYYEDGQLCEVSTHSKKNIVVFFSGYRKLSYWDQSEFGKDLGIIRQLSQMGVVTIDLDPMEWLESIPVICTRFLILLEKLIPSQVLDKVRIVIVGHSYGCFMAIHLGQTMKSIHGVVLLDPVAQDQSYLQHLNADTKDIDNASKIANWALFPEAHLPRHVIARIHLANNPKIKDKLDHFLPMCKANTWSTVEVHACSHMIHYDRPNVVIEAVRQLFRIK